MRPGHVEREDRLAVQIPIEIFDGKLNQPAWVTNLSPSGAFIAIQPPIPLGRGIAFWVQLGAEQLALRGHVRWTRSLPAGPGEFIGSGIRLYDPDGTVAVRLKEAIDRLREGV